MGKRIADDSMLWELLITSSHATQLEIMSTGSVRRGWIIGRFDAAESTMGNKINAQLHDIEYRTAVKRISQIVLERFRRPWLRFDFIFRWTRLGREHQKVLQVLHGFTENVRSCSAQVFAHSRIYGRVCVFPSGNPAKEESSRKRKATSTHRSRWNGYQ